MTLDWSGILFGLGAALFMTGSFLASTAAIRRTPGLTPVGLLANTVVVMSLLSFCGLLLLWQRAFNPHFLGWLPTLVSGLAFWLSGQGIMFFIQRRIDASQVVPLLGLKLPVLAVISLAGMGESFSFWQFTAIALTVIATFMLNNAGKRIPVLYLLAVLMTCVCYSMSDIFLNITTSRIAQDTGISLVSAAAVNTFLTYGVAGIAGALMICLNKSMRGWRKFLNSAPYGVMWVISIVFLCACFVRLGTVNGNIVQSTRSIFAILAAPLLVWLGVSGVETRVSWKITLRRLVAAFLMIAAVALYNYS